MQATLRPIASLECFAVFCLMVVVVMVMGVVTIEMVWVLVLVLGLHIALLAQQPKGILNA